MIRYEPALDGLRGVAALAVLLFHTRVPFLPGGWRGVDVFFVLSGYLITSLLKAELDARDRIDLVGFWRRRARRLLPALFLVCAFYAVAAPLLLNPGLAAWRWRDIAATLTFTYNFDQLAATRVTGLGTMWSLAVEGQFYLVWPLLLVLIHRLNRATFPCLLGLFIALTLYRAIGVTFVADDELILKSPLGRSAGLALGAALAYAPNLPRWLGWTGAAVVLGLIVIPPRSGVIAASPLAMTLSEIGAGALICGLTQPGVLQRAFSIKPLVALGVISYGIYIWHLQFKLATDRLPWGWSTAITVLATLSFATISYLAIERRRTAKVRSPQPA